MKKIIEFLSGKKTTLATIASAILVFCLGRGYLSQDTAELVSWIMVALGFTANVVTTKHYSQMAEKEPTDKYFQEVQSIDEFNQP